MRARLSPGEFDDELLHQTKEEIRAGFAQGIFTAAELDLKFGVHQWRPLERFMRCQSGGKLRLIDSGKLPGHNAATEEDETFMTSSVDFIPAVVARDFELVAAKVWTDIDELGRGTCSHQKLLFQCSQHG